jgi:hypothetical protein
LKYPFWNQQPVFHTYDYWRFLYSIPFLVYPFRPIKKKFYDSTFIKTIPYLECCPEEKKQMLNLIQCYYITANDQILHTMDEAAIDAVLSGGSEEPTFLSFYYSPFPIAPSNILASSIQDEEIRTPIAVVLSRYINIIVFNQQNSNGVLFEFLNSLTKQTPSSEKYPAYLVDYQTVHREYPNIVKLNRTLLQTHEYNQRIKNPNISVTVIKKEIDLFDGVIPLVQYTTSTYVLQKKRFPPLPSHFYISQINMSNTDILIDFFYSIQTLERSAYFDLTPANIPTIRMISDISTLIAMIKANILFAFCLRKAEKIYAFYFWKDAKTQYMLENDTAGDTLQSIATMAIELDSNSRLFYLGFLHALYAIRKQRPSYRILLLEEIGDTKGIHKQWRTKHIPMFSTMTAYYTYNLICPCSPYQPESCFVLL